MLVIMIYLFTSNKTRPIANVMDLNRRKYPLLLTWASLPSTGYFGFVSAIAEATPTVQIRASQYKPLRAHFLFA